MAVTPAVKLKAGVFPEVQEMCVSPSVGRVVLRPYGEEVTVSRLECELMSSDIEYDKDALCVRGELPMTCGLENGALTCRERPWWEEKSSPR